MSFTIERRFDQNRAQLPENSFVNKINFFFGPKELYFLGCFMLLLLLWSARVPGADVGFTIAGSVLSVLYFFSAFRPVPEVSFNKEVAFVLKLAGLSAAVSIVGVQFAVLGWPGRPMLVTGFLTSAVCFVLALGYRKKSNDEETGKRFNQSIYRTLFTAALCLVLYFTPAEKLAELGLTP